MREKPKFEKALDEYEKMFGENYPLVIVSQMSDEEIIAEIERCIASETPAKGPKYDGGSWY